MSCLNDTPNETENQNKYSNYSDDHSYFTITPKNESGCFTEYLENLNNTDNILGLEYLQIGDGLDQSNIGYWRTRRKLPKFLHEFYLLGDTIGKGSYGKVKDCVDIRTMKRYAMKIVHRMKIKKIPGGMKHVENEINLMKTLCHQNVVKLIDDFQELDPERRCLVMEFCLGSIHDLQTNGILESSNQFRCLPEWQTRHYFSQIIDGLEYLHGQGLIHKDMKPGNFLLTEHDNVKITDFGVSERLGMFQTNSLISGGQTTPAIQPPELAIGAPNICGYKLDIYGTGVSLYFMLCGRVPFSNPNILLIFDEIAAGEYTIPDWVSAPASDLIRNMMRKDVNERYDIGKVKSHKWYVEDCAMTGARVDPMVFLNYTARDRTKENLYRLSTGISTMADGKEEELCAIMPITVVSRLRAYYNWPLTEDEENAEIDDQLIIGDDFIGTDGDTYNTNFIQFDDRKDGIRKESDCVPSDIRFFIEPEEQNINNYKGMVSIDAMKLKTDSRRSDAAMDFSVCMSQSTFSPGDYPDKGLIEAAHNTIPKTAASSRNSSSTNHPNSEKKSSSKSKFRFGRKKTTRCTQS